MASRRTAAAEDGAHASDSDREAPPRSQSKSAQKSKTTKLALVHIFWDLDTKLPDGILPEALVRTRLLAPAPWYRLVLGGRSPRNKFYNGVQTGISAHI